MAVDNIESYTDPLRTLANTYKPKTILEVGIGEFGYSTRVWLETGAKVTTVDKNNINDIAGQLSKEYPNFTYIQGDSAEVLTGLHATYELIFIDGDHRYEGAATDIINAQRLLAPAGVIVLDDYGVPNGVVDVDPGGNLIEGDYGIKAAADECFGADWERVDTNIVLANGGAIFRRVQRGTTFKSRKRR